MATLAQIKKLRRLINEPTTDEYSDEELTELIDNNSDLYYIARDIWIEKSAKAMAFDFAADGGDFKRSQIHKQCLEQIAICEKNMKTIAKKSIVEAPTPLLVEMIYN